MRSQALNALREQLVALFHSDEDAKSLASRFQVSPKALRGWWYAEFGREAVAARGKRVLTKINEGRGFVLGDPKLCLKCGKITTDFRASSKNPNRPRSWCSPCEVSLAKAWNENLIPEARGLLLSRKKVYNGTYYSQHKESLRQYAQTYRSLNRNVANERQRNYYTENPHKLMFQLARKRARIRSVPFTISADPIKACIPSDDLCPITHQTFERGVGKLGPKSMTLDCVIPTLGYIPGNIAVISHQANTMKSNCVDSGVFRRMADYVSGTLKVSLGSVAITLPFWMIGRARCRARAKGVPFRLTATEIESTFPSDGHCPITGQLLQVSKGCVRPNSMSLDRVIPSLGYVPGNIMIISHLANTIKQNCTDPEVFRRISDYLESAMVRSI